MGIQRIAKVDLDCYGVGFKVMVAPTIPVSAEENLGDPIDMRMDIIHPKPIVVVAFLAATVVRTLARHGEVIGSIHERLLEMPTQRWEEIDEELLTLREREQIGLRHRGDYRSIEKITRNRERQARVKIEQQLAAVQESQRQDREDFRTFTSPHHVMTAPIIPVFVEENLGDPIDIRIDIIHPEPIAVVAFLAATIVRTLALHEEVIGGIQERLLEMPIQRWEEIEEVLLTLRERANKAETEGITLHARVRSLELIETWLYGIVRDEREACERIER
ncbi:hypothetical protein Tco_0571834 [Tanacetum coccineum]